MTKKKNRFLEDERLKSRKEISRIFKNGIFLYSDFFSLGYTICENNEKTHKFAVSVPKKLFKSAVTRNKLKRRIRESYRIKKHVLYEFSDNSHTFFNILLIYRHRDILSFSIIQNDVIFLLEKLTDKF